MCKHTVGTKKSRKSIRFDRKLYEKTEAKIIGKFKSSASADVKVKNSLLRHQTWITRCIHTEKSFQNLVKSNRNQIVFTMHRLI